MRAVLLDTHVWAWSFADDSRLSDAASRAMGTADMVYVSVISLFEIGQKVRLGKWPQMVPFLGRLAGLAGEQGSRYLPLSPEASLLAATLDWEHRDPFDRIIGATAITAGVSLVSADTCFDALTGRPAWPGRIW